MWWFFHKSTISGTTISGTTIPGTTILPLFTSQIVHKTFQNMDAQFEWNMYIDFESIKYGQMNPVYKCIKCRVTHNSQGAMFESRFVVINNTNRMTCINNNYEYIMKHSNYIGGPKYEIYCINKHKLYLVKTNRIPQLCVIE